MEQGKIILLWGIGMFKFKRVFSIIFLSIFVLMLPQSFAEASAAEENKKSIEITEVQIKKIEELINTEKSKAKIPGLSVVIIQGDRVLLEKGYGYADIKNKIPVTLDTHFELGSTSKAFTALGILKLKEEGKLKLDDKVSKHIPWFKLMYGGKEADITINNLLHQNSGIPPHMLGNIPPSEADSALEAAVRSIVGQELNFYPGVKYQYSTINYDVLGLIIEKVSGQSYEEYIENNIFKPMGLNNTYLNRAEAEKHGMAKGYKYGFTVPVEYYEPVYRGNNPAANVTTNAGDIKKWLRIQLGIEENMTFNKELIAESHIPNRSVDPGSLLSSYAMGWHVFQRGTGELAHSGANPCYYSVLSLRPEEKIGVALMSNIYSYGNQTIADRIMDILMNRQLRRPSPDTNRDMDNVFTAVICMIVPFILALLIFTGIIFYHIAKGRRKFRGIDFEGVKKLALAVLFTAAFAWCLYYLPQIVDTFRNYPWSYIEVWGPFTIIPGINLVLCAAIMLNFYLVLNQFFPDPDEKPYFALVMLSTISGFGNAFIIFIINNAVLKFSNYDYTEGKFQFQTLLFVYFIIGIVIYVYGQRLIRTKMVTIVNTQVFNLRKDLTTRILNTPYYMFEAIEKGKIQACLNNDTETISRFSGTLIFGITSLVTLVFCFIYLGFLNINGLLISIVVIVLAATLYYFVSKAARKLWEETRSIQNVFFKFINDLTSGFKELNLNSSKCGAFREDMIETCDTYRSKRTKGEIKFANAFVIGELLFTLVIGTVAFTFPIVFEDILSTTLSNFIFIFLYMTGPVNGLLNTFPELTQARICWSRINDLKGQLDLLEANKPDNKYNESIDIKGEMKLVLKDLEFTYKNEDGNLFKVGPINYEFRSGELIFVTGGNGSGKSTLAKLITGLYSADKGEILLNGNKLCADQLRQYYSAIFSDFYLFEKLYGIDHENKTEEIEKYLNILQIEKKVSVTDGVFSNINLSTGQRKRLALMISYLEDRPIYLFDEWAADQDPEFRKFFYETLLPDFKNRGKCVIAITHDDRYFDIADRYIKMELGKIIVNEIHTIYGEPAAVKE